MRANLCDGGPASGPSASQLAIRAVRRDVIGVNTRWAYNLAMATERIHCNWCQRRTLHDLLCETSTEEEEDFGPSKIKVKTKFEMLQCCGCEEVILRRTVEDEIPFDDPTVTYFPPPVSRQPPAWLHLRTFPGELRSVFEEIYRSLDANNRLLPMMGARTLIDMLMVEKVGDVGTFDEKLKKLEALGVISSRNREVLAAALDVGSAAAHRGHTPNSDDVNAVMDIVENLVHAVYVLPGMAQRLRTTTPPRPQKSSSKPKLPSSP